MFAGTRYAELLREFDELLSREPSAGALRRWSSFRICDGVPDYLKSAVKRLLKAGRKINRASSPQELHRLRISAKHLRYQFEFFAEIYPALAKPAKAAKRLQDLLGDFQDARSASERLGEYARSLPGGSRRSEPAYAAERGNPQVLALERLLHGQLQKAASVRREFAGSWRRFEKGVAPRKIAAALAR